MTTLLGEVLRYGYPLAAVLIGLESLGAPLPGETLMIALGAAAAAGKFELMRLFAAVWMGSVIGDNIGYAIGHRFGARAIRTFGSSAGLTEERLVRFESLFHRYGVLVVVAARFFVVLRQLNGVLAGSFGLPWWRFLVANATGAALWAGFWLYVSSQVSASVLGHLNLLHPFKLVFIVLLGVALLLILVLSLWKHTGRKL